MSNVISTRAITYIVASSVLFLFYPKRFWYNFFRSNVRVQKLRKIQPSVLFANIFAPINMFVRAIIDDEIRDHLPIFFLHPEQYLTQSVANL